MFWYFIDAAKGTQQISKLNRENVCDRPTGTVKLPWHSTRSLFWETKGHDKTNCQIRPASNISNHGKMGQVEDGQFLL